MGKFNVFLVGLYLDTLELSHNTLQERVYSPKVGLKRFWMDLLGRLLQTVRKKSFSFKSYSNVPNSMGGGT